MQRKTCKHRNERMRGRSANRERKKYFSFSLYSFLSLKPILHTPLTLSLDFLDAQSRPQDIFTERSGGVAAIVCDTAGNTVRQGYCYTCLAIGGVIPVGSLRYDHVIKDKVSTAPVPV